MTFMEWSNALSVHNSDIDREHQHIVQLVNALYLDVRNARPPQVIEEHLAALGTAVARHFVHEEGLMQAASYGRLEEYQRSNASMARRNADFLARYRVGEATMTLNQVIFLRAWLNSHILEAHGCFAVKGPAVPVPVLRGMRAGFDTLR
jgi:hemerythrin-like metal-binding protein